MSFNVHMFTESWVVGCSHVHWVWLHFTHFWLIGEVCVCGAWSGASSLIQLRLPTRIVAWRDGDYNM